jgi:hypothetical protein
VAAQGALGIISLSQVDGHSLVSHRTQVAGALHQSRAKLRRSALFVVVCAEEKGLLGSRYFAAKPTVPACAMVADLNTDMFLPIVPLNYFVVFVNQPVDLAAADNVEPCSARGGRLLEHPMCQHCLR